MDSNNDIAIKINSNIKSLVNGRDMMMTKVSTFNRAPLEIVTLIEIKSTIHKTHKLI